MYSFHHPLLQTVPGVTVGEAQDEEDACEDVMEIEDTDTFLRFVFTMVMDEHIPGGEQCK